ncbi:MAG: hypothetical protein FWG64_04085, partial [Firmicutes bacterium]|nr:hypothetical protein [Bacillota bacterium]
PDKYLLLYATMLQYFTDKQNEIVYHPHPTRGSSITNLEPLKQRNVKYIDANMPIEFLLWIPNIKIKQLLLLQSTAQNKLATMVDETTALTKEYIKVFNILDKLYVIQAIINRLTLHTNLKFYGISQKVFETMYKFNFSEYLYKKFAYQETCQNAELQPNDIFVINTTLQDIEPISNQNFILDMLNQAAENSIIFFTNIFGESPFIELLTPIFDENPATEQVKTTVSDFIVPIQIDRSPLDDGEQVGELGTTAIFAFCKNAKTRQYLREIRLTKNLQYLNVVLNVSPISEETAQSWMQQAYNHAVIAAVVNNFNNKIINQKNDEIRQKDSEIHRTNEIIQQSNEEIHQKNEEINHKNNEIYQKGEEINHKNNEIWQINETIHHKNEEIDHLKNRITELETSTSWKITKPLRNIKKAFWALIE